MVRPSLRALIVLIVAVDFLLLGLHLVITQWHLLGGKVLREMFDLDSEANIPTWWASMLWAGTALAAYACHLKDGRRGTSWASLAWLLVAGIFLGASMDEVATVHEEMGTFLQTEFLQHGWFRLYPEGAPDSPWILFYAPFLIAFAIALLWFVRRTFVRHPRLAWLVAAALVCQVVAITMDYYQGMTVEREAAIATRIGWGWGPKSLVDASVAVEETLENIATTCLLAAFASYALADPASAIPD